MKRFFALLLFDCGAAMELLGTHETDAAAVAMRLRTERTALVERWKMAAPQRPPGRLRRFALHPIWTYSPAMILEAVRLHHLANGKPREIPAVEYVFPDDSQPWRN